MKIQITYKLLSFFHSQKAKNIIKLPIISKNNQEVQEPITGSNINRSNIGQFFIFSPIHSNKNLFKLINLWQNFYLAGRKYLGTEGRVKNRQSYFMVYLHNRKTICIRDLINFILQTYQNLVILMPKRFIRFNLMQDESKKSLFLRDVKANFIVILEKKTFQLHKQLLTPSEFFRQAIAKDKKSIIINQHLNVDCFEKMLGCFYGIQAAFQRHNIIAYLLDILSLLKVKELNDQLKADMRNNFEEYGLFNLFYLSRMFSLKDIEEKCLKQLIDQEFQPINYNKYDLFQLSPQLFIFVLKQHERLKAIRTITGLDTNQIRAVCQQYCKTNTGVSINAQQILNYGREFQKQVMVDSGSDEENGPTIRKRNATWTSMPEKQEKIKKVKTQECNSQSQQKIYTFEDRTDEVLKIKQINSNMQQSNHKLAEEIRSVRMTIDQKHHRDSPDTMDDLDKRLKQFEQKSKSAHKKMQDLKNKMSQLKFDEDKNQEIQKNHIYGSSQKGGKDGRKDEKNSTILSQMAVLKKTEDLDSDSNEQY